MEATVRQKQEVKERKKQRLSSQNPKLKRTKESENSGGQKVNGKKRRKRSGKKLSPEKPERKLEGKGEPEEAAAEIEAGGRRKEIADEACMKLCVWKSKDGNHRFV